MNLSYQQARAQDILKQVDQTSKSIDILQQQLALQQASAAATDEQTKAFHDTVDTINHVRDNLANFDDFFRPLRSYFYWEKALFRHPGLSRLEIGVRLPRRHRASWPTSSGRSPRVWTNSTPCSRSSSP